MKNILINPSDAIMLLIDHQSSLFNLVKDMPVHNVRQNIIALAKLATLQKIPVITTALVPDGPNGPNSHKYKPHKESNKREDNC